MNFLPGKSWLKANGVRLYFDFRLLRIWETYASSILRINQKITIKPQTAVVCQGKLNSGFCVSKSKLLEVVNLNGCIGDDTE